MASISSFVKLLVGHSCARAQPCHETWGGGHPQRDWYLLMSALRVGLPPYSKAKYHCTWKLSTIAIATERLD